MPQSTLAHYQPLLFVTLHLRGKWPLFTDPVFAREAVECLYRIQYYNPFFLFGFVIMPDHCQFLLLASDTQKPIDHIMEMYKRAVSFNIDFGEIWDTELHCRVADDAQAALHFIHHNPVQAGLCLQPKDYRWSSASGRWDVIEL